LLWVSAAECGALDFRRAWRRVADSGLEILAHPMGETRTFSDMRTSSEYHRVSHPTQRVQPQKLANETDSTIRARPSEAYRPHAVNLTVPQRLWIQPP
jgi:hypothetical protein